MSRYLEHSENCKATVVEKDTADDDLIYLYGTNQI